MPTAELFAKIVCATNDYNDNKDEFRDFLPGLEGETVLDPFLNCSREGDFRKPALMHSVTDYALYPHLAHFTSAPGLFAQLTGELDSLAARSQRIAEHADALRERGRRFYRQAVELLLA